MFRSKTVFILGAGASQDLGLPVGEDLKSDIAEMLDIKFKHPYSNELTCGSYEIADAIRVLAKRPDGSNDINSYLHAARKLGSALTHGTSIDDTFATHKDDKELEVCGKLGIVKAILDAERRSHIYFNSRERGAMNFSSLGKTGFAGLTAGIVENTHRESYQEIFDNISIVNFNYDRCLEHYLYYALKEYYNLDDNQASKLIIDANIFHPYGVVGKLPWQEPNQLEHIAFGSERVSLPKFYNGIKTFNEELGETDEIKKIRELTASAEIIVFLGFAFHRQNLRLLNPGKKSKVRRVYATASGISESDCSVIKDELVGMLQPDVANLRIELSSNLKCGQLFKEYWRSLTANI